MVERAARQVWDAPADGQRWERYREMDKAERGCSSQSSLSAAPSDTSLVRAEPRVEPPKLTLSVSSRGQRARQESWHSLGMLDLGSPMRELMAPSRNVGCIGAISSSCDWSINPGKKRH